MGISGASDQPFDLETTNNSWTTIYTAGINTDRTVVVHATIDAFAPSSGDGLQATVRALLRRDSGAVGPVFSLVYDLLNVQKTVGALLWDVRVRAGSTDVFVEVKGKSAASTFWRSEGFVFSFEDVAV